MAFSSLLSAKVPYSRYVELIQILFGKIKKISVFEQKNAFVVDIGGSVFVCKFQQIVRRVENLSNHREENL